MKTSNAVKRKLGTNKGFTLIEMAIVLVIIGIIIGAVVKGQDLVSNAQAKQLNAAVSSWRTLAYAFLDRNGRFPGDQLRDGLIGNQAGEQTSALSSMAELVGSMRNYPGNPVLIGSQNYFVYFGNVTGVGTVPANRNAIFICAVASCAAALTADQVENIRALDTAFDTSADAGIGQFRALSAAPAVTAAGAAVANTSPAVTAGTLTAPVGSITSGASSVGATTLWAAGQFGAVWLFDQPF